MDGFLLQDWMAVRLPYNTAPLAQDEASWRDLSRYRDLAVWLEVRSIDLAAGITGIVVSYETSPTKDESLFVSLATSSTLTAPLATPEVKRVLLGANPTVPLARWLRWKLSTTGTGTSGVSAITFRVTLAANLS